MKTRIRNRETWCWFAVTSAIALAGCASTNLSTTAAPASMGDTSSSAKLPPMYLRESRGCAVVSGGALGSEFADPKITGIWAKINQEVATRIHENFVRDGYEVYQVTVSDEQRESARDLIIRAMAEHRCNRLIQLTHLVDEDLAGRYFTFKLDMLRMVPNGTDAASGTSVTTQPEYQREYRNARTKQVFDGFRFPEFGDKVYGDLKDSGKLQSIRR